MLRLSLVLNKSYRLALIGANWHHVGPAPSDARISYGDFVIQSGDGGSDLKMRSVAIPFGWLRELNKPYGRLRDKDVQHLNASGELYVCSPMLHAMPAVEDGQLDSDCLININGDNRLVAGVTTWGGDIRKRDITCVPGSYSPVLDADLLLHDWTADREILFEGEYGRYEHIERISTKKWKSKVPPYAEWTEPGGVVGKTMCFLYRNPVGLEDGLYRSDWVFTNPTSTDDNIMRLYNVHGELIPTSQLSLVGYRHGYPPLVRIDSDVWGDHDDIDQLKFLFHRAIHTLSHVKYHGLVMDMLHPETGDEEPFDWGKLTTSLVRQQKWVDADLFLAAFDLVQGKELLTALGNSSKFLVDKIPNLLTDFSLGDLSRNFQPVKAVLKEGTSTFFGVNYGVLPSSRDMSAVLSSLSAMFRRLTKLNRTHARDTTSVEGRLGTQVDVLRTLTAESAVLPHTLDPISWAMDSVSAAKKMGIYPSFTAAWDAVPFSFVVNWMKLPLNPDGNVERLDTAIDVQYFPISHCIQGEKRSLSIPSETLFPELGINGSITFTYYTRYVSLELPLTPPCLEKTGEEESETGPFKHWVELGCLVVQSLVSKG